MSIKKQYSKKKQICKVTFDVPAEADRDLQTVHVVGEFNGWSTTATPMKRKKNGVYSTTVDLQPGQEYQFRYLLDNTQWENDNEADKYAETPYRDAVNSVIVI